jgi:Uma2 family endonuclease
MSTAAKKRLTSQEYLAIDRASEFRNELYDGEMFAMSGGTPRHSKIKANLIRALGNALEGNPCSVYDSDLRIGVVATGFYAYPDASVFCGQLEYDDEKRDTLTNPTLLN